MAAFFALRWCVASAFFLRRCLALGSVVVRTFQSTTTIACLLHQIVNFHTILQMFRVKTLRPSFFLFCTVSHACDARSRHDTASSRRSNDSCRPRTRSSSTTALAGTCASGQDRKRDSRSFFQKTRENLREDEIITHDTGEVGEGNFREYAV